jgi:hypothetical protein
VSDETLLGWVRKRPDLAEAQACISWAFSHLAPLTRRLDEWLERSVDTELRDPGENATHNLIIGVEKEPLPLSFNVEVGAYVNTIRSSLDILAMVLVRRHGLDVKEDQVYFPIARSETAFNDRNWAGRKLLNALPPQDRQVIESLKPYKGGSEGLWTLHHLDILRKHRRLLSVELHPISITLKGTLKEGDFEPLAVEAVHVNEETIIGMLRKGVSPTLVRSKFYVRMNEEGELPRRPVSATLVYLIDMVTGIIALFDY